MRSRSSIILIIDRIMSNLIRIIIIHRIGVIIIVRIRDRIRTDEESRSSYYCSILAYYYDGQ